MTRSRIHDILHSLSAVAADRRMLGRGLAAAAAAGVAARLGFDDGEAKRKKKRKKKCPAGRTRCGRRCIETIADPANCGACGRACGAGETCSDGFCVVVTDAANLADVLDFPRGIAVDAEGSLVVVDLDLDHIERFVPGGVDFLLRGSSGSADGLFNGPAGVAASADHIFVADTGNHRIQRFDARDANHQLSFGTRGAGRDQFNNPGAVEIDPGGNLIYVADTLNNRVTFHDLNGTAINQFGGPGSGNGQFNLPVDVAVRSLGGARRHIYVADLSNNRIQVVDDELRFVTAFGRRGSADGEFLGPRGVAVARDGTVFVSDGGNDRIQQFTADGRFLRAFGREGSAPGELRSPEGLAVGPDGAIHVCDAGNQRIQSFKPKPPAASKSGASTDKANDKGKGKGEDDDTFEDTDKNADADARRRGRGGKSRRTPAA